MLNFNNFYTPYCIIATSRNEGCYSQVIPSVGLRNFIYCYWISPSYPDSKLFELKPPKNEFIVPDGCSDIVFVVDRKTKECQCTVFGAFEKPYAVNLAYDKFLIFGITFFPGGIYSLLKIPLNQIKNKSFELGNVMDASWKKLYSEIVNADSIAEMVYASNKYFSLVIDNHHINDSLCNMLYNIYLCKGKITIKELAQNEVISERQAGRIFNNWVGISPKTFSRIVRFQNVIKSTINKKDFDWTLLALEHGYFDEAHFFNEFKEFYGITPANYLKIINCV